MLTSYNSVNPFNGRVTSVGHFGPNPVPIVGVGDVTLDLPGPDPPPVASLRPGFRAVGRITIGNVMHIPTAGINIISWSALKKAKGLNLHLVENNDGSLGVHHDSLQIMRFVLRDGLYFLDQGEQHVEHQDGSSSST